MRKLLAAAVLAVALVAPAFAADEISPERVALAKEVIELSGANKVYDNFDKNLDMVMGQMMQDKPNVDQATIDDIKKMMKEEFAAFKPQMIDNAVKIYARHFSEDDLRAMIAFYKSDAGQHLSAELPAISQETAQMNVEFMKHFMARMQKYMADKIAAQKAAADQEKSKTK